MAMAIWSDAIILHYTDWKLISGINGVCMMSSKLKTRAEKEKQDNCIGQQTEDKVKRKKRSGSGCQNKMSVKITNKKPVPEANKAFPDLLSQVTMCTLNVIFLCLLTEWWNQPQFGSFLAEFCIFHQQAAVVETGNKNIVKQTRPQFYVAGVAYILYI